MEREGIDLQRGMMFRDLEERISVFLVLPHDGEFKDEWDERQKRYTFRGHDSTTVESGREKDQIAMYASGRLSENGKFLKAANAYKEGTRSDPLPVQIYEKIDSGVWFDKGIFHLIYAARVDSGGRMVFEFHLTLANLSRIADDAHHDERMLSASAKAQAWQSGRGRCNGCATQSGLRFVADARSREVSLMCPRCRSEDIGLLG